MIIGEILKIFIIFILFLSFFPWNALAQIEPPNANTGKKILDKTGNATKSFLTTLGRGMGKALDSILPFVRDNDQTVTQWWNNKAKPWFLNIWSSVKNYFDQEVIIN